MLAILPVLDEQNRIQSTLEYYSVILPCQLVIVDAGSSDSTINLCHRYSKLFRHPIHLTCRPNNGTTEEQDWIDWLINSFPSDYYLFLSCSERIPAQSINLYQTHSSNAIDLVYVPRRSLLNEDDISLVYSRLQDLIIFRSTYFPVCRFASSLALQQIPTIIHDNWLSSAHLVNTLFVRNPVNCIEHRKNPDIYLNLRKHIDYAKNEAMLGFPLIKYTLKIHRELTYLFLLAVTLRLNRSILTELLMRIIYHLNIITIRVSSTPN